MESRDLGEKIVRTLKTIYDPEIPVDIYELGLIYDVFVNEDNHVKVIMTLTTPNCPVAETLPVEVEDKVKTIEGVVDAKVELTLASTTPSIVFTLYSTSTGSVSATGQLGVVSVIMTLT
jgi:metal-sulfur cluster biosynthetic enzyme